MNLLEEMRERNFKVICIEPYVYCKVFADNAGALELASLPKLRPQTKHIMFAIIIFVNMWARDSSRSSLSTPKTRLLTLSQKLWHNMTPQLMWLSG